MIDPTVSGIPKRPYAVALGPARSSAAARPTRDPATEGRAGNDAARRDGETPTYAARRGYVCPVARRSSRTREAMRLIPTGVTPI